MKPLSPEMVAELTQKNMPSESPILVRLFKQEAELEVWKQDASGRYALLKTYPICRWSGELGPKIKEGDRQAPEGFYNITPAQMNPNSQYYLAFNMGYPERLRRAHGRTGAHLMVHGDCSSRGCYAMTDEQIGEIYALGARVVLRRPALVPGAGLSVPHDAGEHRQASQQSEHRRSGGCSRKATTISRSRARSRRSTSARSATCSTPIAAEAHRRRHQARHAVGRLPVGAAAQVSLKFNPAGKCPAYEVPPDVSPR